LQDRAEIPETGVPERESMPEPEARAGLFARDWAEKDAGRMEAEPLFAARVSLENSLRQLR